MRVYRFQGKRRIENRIDKKVKHEIETGFVEFTWYRMQRVCPVLVLLQLD